MSKSEKKEKGIQYYSNCEKLWVWGSETDVRRQQVEDQMSAAYSPKQDILFYTHDPVTNQFGGYKGVLSWSAEKNIFIYSDLIDGHPVQYYRVSKTGRLTQKVSDKDQSYILYG